MKQVKAFALFWWDFIVGDDWLVAAVVVIALAVTAALVHGASLNAWWLPPVVVVAVLPVSVLRLARR